MQDLNPEAVVVVWKKTERSNKKYNRAKNPVIPNESPFIELGVGASFVERWMKKYKLNKYQLWPPKK